MFVSGGQATILHADLDSFYASVEQRDDPTLRGRPVIVGGGVVLAASYEAKAYGVRTAMGGRQARRLCPAAVVVPPRMSAYSRASEAVFEVFHDTTPAGRAAVDRRGVPRRVAGCAGCRAPRCRSPPDCATEVRDRVGLPITVGIARTKFLAKVASQEAKPDGLLLVPPDRELAFLHPLPGAAAVGGGRQDRRKSCTPTASTPSPTSPSSASPCWGRWSAARWAVSCSRCPATSTAAGCVTGVRRRSVGAQRALGRGRVTPCRPAEIDAVVINLVDRITRRMRTADRTGRTVVLRLRFDDFSRVTRSHTMPRATASTDADPRRGPGSRRRRRAADRRARAHADRLRGVQHRPRRSPATGAAVRTAAGRSCWTSTRPSTRCAAATATPR